MESTYVDDIHSKEHAYAEMDCISFIILHVREGACVDYTRRNTEGTSLELDWSSAQPEHSTMPLGR